MSAKDGERTRQRGKPVIVIGASTGVFGATLVQAELRRVLSAMGAAVLDAQLPVSEAQDAFAQDGRLRMERDNGPVGDRGTRRLSTTRVQHAINRVHDWRQIVVRPKNLERPRLSNHLLERSL